MLLDELSEPAGGTRIAEARAGRGTGLGLAALVVLLALGFLFVAREWWVRAHETVAPSVDSGIDARLEELSHALQKMEKIAGTLEGLAADLTTRPDPTPAPTTASIAEEDPFFLHAVVDGETLWSIAERYYGKGVRYPLLMEHNARLGVQVGPHVGRIRILKDPKAAADLFERLSFLKEGRRFFRYKVNEGDTWSDIARRFHRNPAKGDRLRALNQTAELKTGDRIMVPLE